jgi:hypothetical protein
MRVRGLVVVALAVGAFLALYAAGQASQDDAGDTGLVPPAPIEADLDRTDAPPRLGRSGPLPNLKPARRRSPAPAPAPAAPASPPASAPPAPAPPPPPAPAPPPERGTPFYDDG